MFQSGDPEQNVATLTLTRPPPALSGLYLVSMGVRSSFRALEISPQQRFRSSGGQIRRQDVVLRVRSPLASVQNGCPPLELLTGLKLTARHRCLREECVCVCARYTPVVFGEAS